MDTSSIAIKSGRWKTRGKLIAALQKTTPESIEFGGGVRFWAGASRLHHLQQAQTRNADDLSRMPNLSDDSVVRTVALGMTADKTRHPAGGAYSERTKTWSRMVLKASDRSRGLGIDEEFKTTVPSGTWRRCRRKMEDIRGNGKSIGQVHS